MKNIKMLRGLIAVFVLCDIVTLLSSLYGIYLLYPASDGPYYLSFINISASLIKEMLLLPCLILLFQTVHYFIKSGYFNNRSAAKLKLAGILIMVAAILGFISVLLLRQQLIYALDMEKTKTIKWMNELPELFTLLLAGFGLYTLSGFIRKGEAIERENELTI